MKILSVDTAANVASAAIVDGDKLVCEVTINNKKTHSQTLMPIIDTILNHAGMEISDMDFLAVANGPGSFTGLRIGVSAVKGLAYAKNIPVVGISTLEAMAYNLPFCKFSISPIMDARRQQVYNAVYEWENGELIEKKAPRALGIDELCEELGKVGKKVVFVGDAAAVYKEIIIEKLGDMAVFAPSCAAEQRASSLAIAAKKRYQKTGGESAFELSPVYLRKSQAEREAEEKKNKEK